MNLRELSRHLGLSQTTVSRALGGYPEVSARTRDRVREAAREMGYSPNRSARRLASGKAGAVGMVLPLPVGHFADPFFLELMIGIGERLDADDLDLVVTAAPAGEPEMQAYRRLVGERRVDGMIVARTRSDDARLAELRASGAAFVAFGRSDPPLDYAYLDVDAESAFAEASRTLIDLGHRRIALINAPGGLHLARVRRRGYADALAGAGLPLDPALMPEAEMTEAGGAAAAERLLGLTEPPTAVLTANDPMAIGAMRAFRAAGLRVPEHLSIIGYDDLPVAPLTEPPLTTVRQPIRAAGRRLAELLLRRLAGEPAERLQEVWPAQLVPRGSHGTAPARAAAPG